MSCTHAAAAVACNIWTIVPKHATSAQQASDTLQLSPTAACQLVVAVLLLPSSTAAVSVVMANQLDWTYYSTQLQTQAALPRGLACAAAYVQRLLVLLRILQLLVGKSSRHRCGAFLQAQRSLSQTQPRRLHHACHQHPSPILPPATDPLQQNITTWRTSQHPTSSEGWRCARTSCRYSAAWCVLLAIVLQCSV